MAPSLTKRLAFLAALACSNVAAYSTFEFVPAVPSPSSGAGIEQSIITITSSFDSTYTIVRATPTRSIATVTTCMAGTVSPIGGCQNTVYSTAGKFYSEQCDNAAVTGVVRINGPGVKDINSCLSYCIHFSAYCDMAVYNPTSTYCQLAQSSPTAPAVAATTWSSGIQVVSIYNADPCVATVTKTGTEYSTETITTRVITVFESTITSSAASSSSSMESSSKTPSSTVSISACSATPAAAVQESVVTLTSTYASTYSSVFTTTSASLQTVTTCTPSQFTAGRCQNGVYALGTKYYDQHCDGASLSGGATVLVLPAAQIFLCNQYCSVYSTLCSGYNYNTAARVCTFLSGSSLHFASAVAYQAAIAFTTDPCVVTSTVIDTQYSTQTLSSDVTSLYESTITISVSASSCTPTATPETASSLAITSSSLAMNVSSNVVPSKTSVPATSMIANSTATSLMIMPTSLLNSTSTTVLVPVTNSSMTTSAHFNTPVSVMSNNSMPSSSVSNNSSVPTDLVYTNSSMSTSSVFFNSSVIHSLPTTTPSTQSNTSVSATTFKTNLTSIASSSVAAPYTNTTSSAPINIAIPTMSISSVIILPTLMPSIPGESVISSSAQSKTTLPTTSSSVLATSDEFVSSSTGLSASNAESVISGTMSTSASAMIASSTALSSSSSTVLSSSVSPLTQMTSPTSKSAMITSGVPTIRLSTSTIFTTRTATVTACPPEVTGCPAKSQSTYLTTETLVLTITVCPVIEVPQPMTAVGLSKIEYTTSTVLSTRISTITACPSSVLNCPASSQQTFYITETVVVSTTVCPISGVKTASAPAQTAEPLVTNLSEIQSTPQAAMTVVLSSPSSAIETYGHQIPAASVESQTVLKHSTQNLIVSSSLTPLSGSTVTASSATPAATQMTFGYVPSSVVLSSASPAYTEGYRTSTSLVSGSSIKATPSSSPDVYQSPNISNQVSSSKTGSIGAFQLSSTATQILPSANLATGISRLNSTSSSLGASQTSNTTGSHKPALYTGAASSVQWSLFLILGSVIAFAMIITL